jgi:hypothetical protein
MAALINLSLGTWVAGLVFFVNFVEHLVKSLVKAFQLAAGTAKMAFLMFQKDYAEAMKQHKKNSELGKESGDEFLKSFTVSSKEAAEAFMKFGKDVGGTNIIMQKSFNDLSLKAKDFFDTLNTSSALDVSLSQLPDSVARDIRATHGDGFLDKIKQAGVNDKEVSSDYKDITGEIEKAFKDVADTSGDAAKKAAKNADSLKNSIDGFISSIRQQTEALADFGSMFQKNIYDRMNPTKLMLRLRQNFDQIKKWIDSLNKLKARGVSADIIQGFREMGVSSVNITDTLSKMSDKALTEATGYMTGIERKAATQAYEMVKHDHTGVIRVEGVNAKGELVDKGIIQKISQEIETGAKRYTNYQQPSKMFK